jgi:hypothetical protein
MHESVAKAVVSPKGPLGSLLLVALLFPAAAWSQDPLPVNPFGPAKQAEKPSGDEEPPRLNPFGPVKRDRDDAAPGYVEMSDGRILVGDIYMTRDKRLKVYDPKMERQREIPLQRVKQIECKVVKEWMEKEWRFKELALDKKYYTGKSYPARQYVHTITLDDDRTLDGELAEILYVQPYGNDPDKPLADRPDIKPERVMLHKRDKGEIGTDLKSLVYVKLVKLGTEAYEEGKQKASRYRPRRKAAEPKAF